MPFLRCKQCQKVWQYSIKKCPNCFLNLEKLKSQKAKVIGISKVFLPSIFHSKIPYFVLLLEDENGNKWVQKSEKEYKIGEEFKLEILKDERAIAIWRVKYDFLEAIEKVVELLGGIKINEKTKILILPTLVKESHPYFRDNTSPQFLSTILEFLFQLGAEPENIKVASQSFDEIEIGQKAVKSGLLEICQKYKVMPLDLAKGKFLKKGDLEISEDVFESDLILNLPILKMGRAQASENLFVLVKKENFLAQKYLYSEKEIFDKLKKEIPEILTVAEANHVQDEKGFTHYLNLVLASFLPQNLDFVFSKIVNHQLPEILKDVNIENIPILGRQVEEIKFYGS